MPVEGGYDSVTVAIYKAEHAGSSPPVNFRDPVWMRWRGDKLNGFFRRLRDSVKARSPQLLVSSTPSVYPWGYEEYLQDAKTWLDSSIVDHLIPQIYRYDYGSYVTQLNSSLSYVPASKRTSFYAGVLAKVGTYYITTGLLDSCIAANRARNVMGESLFFYEALRYESNRRGDSLKATFYSDRAITPWRNGSVWRPKAVIVDESDSGANVSSGWQLFSGFPDITFRPNFRMATDTGYASITYSFNVPNTAYYDVYVYVVVNSIGTTAAPFTIYSSTDSAKTTVNQSTSGDPGWQKIGTVLLEEGYQQVLKIENVGIGTGKRVMADAAMIMINRKRSPDVVFSAVEYNQLYKDVSPARFRLFQNFPNPFNPTTTIAYQIPETSRITLSVFDLLGRRVAVLEDGIRRSGEHRVQFSAHGLPSGTYFYRLEAMPIEGLARNAQVDTGKLLVVK